MIERLFLLIPLIIGVLIIVLSIVKSIQVILASATGMLEVLLNELKIVGGKKYWKKATHAQRIDFIIIVLTIVFAIIVVVATGIPSLLQMIGVPNAVPIGSGHIIVAEILIGLVVIVSIWFCVAIERERRR